ncbi:MAG: hypothetical protein JXQ23_04275 [Clostridia bacterium]|nr:hypothetical protein [Clostridia bacterium]
MGNKEFYLGWQVGITYGSAKPEGNSFKYMIRLLDEMSDHGMNYLSLMMTSYAYFDKGHDGFSWPVRNRKLECLRDKNALNANEKTEYVSAVIEEAKKRGIGIQLFSNLSIYNPEKIIFSFPEATEQKQKNGQSCPWLFCPECDDVLQAENSEIEDLLTYYHHENVCSIGYERLSFSPGSCYCRFCQEKFFNDTGKNIFDYQDGDLLFDEWKNKNISEKLYNFNRRIKDKKNDIEIWLHTSCAKGWGHQPDKLQDSLVDYVMPHIAHFKTTRQEYISKMDKLAPCEMVLQMCVRNKGLQNYPLWEKTPQIIAEVGEWIYDYVQQDHRLKGVVFFNENNVSDDNRNAVYQLVERLKK